MKKFLNKSIIYISPFILLYTITLLFYSSNQGDLIRIGYLPKDNAYRDQFKEEFNNHIHYENITSIDTNNVLKYSVLTIGDSFSNCKGYGYNNYLAEFDSITVLHYTNDKNDINPIETLYGLINGNLFNKVSFDYIILQSAEREFVGRAENLSKETQIFLNDIVQIDFEHSKNKTPLRFMKLIPPVALLKFPIYNILYCFRDDAFMSNAHRVSTIKPMFTAKRESQLLFHSEDIENVRLNNNKEAVRNLNDELNILSKLLSKQDICLIILPSPDKYDIYYEYIQNKEKYTKPLFFEYMQEMEMDYLYIDSKKILGNAINNRKDIYFADDTHWSPWGSQLIANELATIINTNKKMFHVEDIKGNQ